MLISKKHRLAILTHLFKEGAMADCLWRSLCVKGQHGGALDFKEMLGCFSHPDARPLAAAATSSDDAAAPPAARRSSSSSSAAGKAWIEVYRLSMSSLRNTICLDTGRGYAKYGLANASSPRSIQICQPRAEATQETLYQLAFRRLELRRCDLPEMAMIVAEPFRLAAAAATQEREVWRYSTERRVLQGFQLKKLCAPRPCPRHCTPPLPGPLHPSPVPPTPPVPVPPKAPVGR